MPIPIPIPDWWAIPYRKSKRLLGRIEMLGIVTRVTRWSEFEQRLGEALVADEREQQRSNE